MTPPDLLNLAAGAAVLGLATLAAALGLGMRTRPARLLTAFFACFALAHLLGTLLLGGGAWLAVESVRWLRVIEIPLVYLLGPLLYGYAVALTSNRGKPGFPIRLWHLLPAAAALVVSLANALAPFDTTATGAAVFLLSFHGWMFQGAPYLVAAIWRSYGARASLEQVSADEAALHLGWLRWLAIAIAACWVSSAINRWPPTMAEVSWAWFGVVLNWTTTAAIYLLAWFGLRQRILVPSGLAPPGQLHATGFHADAARARYERSGLDTTHCLAVAAELTRLMETERLYADPEFDLLRLSQRSGWPPNHVSQALNQGLGQNFFEFVNTFRIAAATACLADAGDRRSVLEIALAAGFGSKSTFNTVFKRMTGRTPREYRRQPVPVTGTAPCH